MEIDKLPKKDENESFKLTILIIFIVHSSMLIIFSLFLKYAEKYRSAGVLMILNFIAIIGSYILCIVKRFSLPGKICAGHYDELFALSTLIERGKFFMMYIIAFPVFVIIIIIAICMARNDRN